jgi:hypothetical protein
VTVNLKTGETKFTDDYDEFLEFKQELASTARPSPTRADRWRVLRCASSATRSTTRCRRSSTGRLRGLGLEAGVRRVQVAAGGLAGFVDGLDPPSGAGCR